MGNTAGPNGQMGGSGNSQPWGNPYAANGPNPYSYMQNQGWGQTGDVLGGFGGGSMRNYQPTWNGRGGGIMDLAGQRAALQPMVQSALNAPDGGQGAPDITSIVGNVNRMNNTRSQQLGGYGQGYGGGGYARGK